eukprot:TRINITY_DN3309_c0_g1_i1.p1 TRINITY_DN3309_c0_g1~~TRINITY_DN3309_c0_g1_i1.p1  ORF type:complete len:929 (+),score=229.10 TRINITY_DN3309_c0_g1_i1:412-2787(+)
MTYAQAWDISQTVSGIKWIGLLKPEYKLGPELVNPTKYSTSSRPLTLTVVLPTKPGSAQPTLEEINTKIAGWVSDFLANYAPKATAVKGDVVNHDRVKFQLNSEDALNAFISYLQQENDVHYIQRDVSFKTYNAYTKGVVQIANENMADYLNEVGLIMWNYNLRGWNQTIGVADSGVDYRSCFFADTLSATPAAPNFVNAVNAPTSTALAASVTRSKRKIVQYVVFADNNDENPMLEGHGTHVSGSLVGYPVLDDVIDYRQVSGTQTKAQLAFFDIGPANGTGLSLPGSLVTGLFPYPYAAGARIHSNSWGGDTNTYTTEAADVDTFMSQNKDFLVLIAAGNTGTCSTSLSTVGTPATAKNCIAVGASINAAPSWAQFTTDATYATFGPSNFDENSMAFFSSMGPSSDNRLKPDVSAPGYYVTSARNGQTNGATCDFNNLQNNVRVLAGTSMATPTLASHVSMIREYFQQGFYPSGKRTPANAFNASGSLLKAMTIAGSVIMSGVKISYGTDMNGNTCSVQGKVNLKGSPYYDQGFGRYQANEILYFASSQNRFLHIPTLANTTSTAANFWDTAVTTTTPLTYNYCVYPNATVPISVVLVWTDPASSTTAATNLVNNLDLSVTYNGQTVAGNSQSAYFTAANQAGTDKLNPVEVVSFTGNSGTTALPMTVTVKAATIAVGTSQLFSLVVSGYISAGACGTAPAIAATFVPGSSVNSVSLPDRPTNDTAPATIPDPTVGATGLAKVLGNTNIGVVIGVIVGVVLVLGAAYYVVTRRRSATSRDRQAALLSQR